MSTPTAAATTAAPYDQAAFAAFLDGRDEPAWVTESRRAAFATYSELVAEPLEEEEWKRVELRAFQPDAYTLQPAGSQTPPPPTLMRDRAEYAGHVVHVNGQAVDESLDEALASSGVRFGDLSRLVREEPDLLEPHLLSRGVAGDTDRFSAWHAAFWTGGTVLYVPAGVEVTSPLYSLVGLAADAAADFSHTLVILENGARATLLEETASADSNTTGLHVGAVELLVAAGARLQYVQLQNWNERTWHIAHQAGRVDADASLQWTVAGLGGRLTHIHQDVRLDGRGAHAEVNGLSFATGRQRMSYYTQQSHHAPDTSSDLLYRTVLRDNSRGVWRGMIRVDPEAQKTDGYQRNDTLLLSPDARIDAIPGLEIEADDVRCTHGATAGRVNAGQVFYLMSRGLSEYEAMHMIVHGFFQVVSDRISIDLVREALGQAVERKLGIAD
ncbi:MAG: Fe-S cluster assembly protein SufD [Planctomycetaceae bacterium]|nr:Fe-S cluster assembly protein SufD [Planctomycetaceae bacterium]